jgi:hypothetical protein
MVMTHRYFHFGDLMPIPPCLSFDRDNFSGSSPVDSALVYREPISISSQFRDKFATDFVLNGMTMGV